MKILKLRYAFLMLIMPVSSQAKVVAELPRAGCYQTDWTARSEMRANGELVKVTTSSIDGSTGFYRIRVEIPNGNGWSKEQPGKGPFFKEVQLSGSSLVSMCPATNTYDGNNGFDITIACGGGTLDPGKLQFKRIPGPIEKWEVKNDTVVTSQVGLNNAAAVQNDMTATLEKVLNNAQPRTAAERKQIAKQREALNTLKQQSPYDERIETMRKAAQERARMGTAEERAAANLALTGGRIQHFNGVVEVLTWAGSRCPG
jgi:hypothetical protein